MQRYLTPYHFLSLAMTIHLQQACYPYCGQGVATTNFKYQRSPSCESLTCMGFWIAENRSKQIHTAGTDAQQIYAEPTIIQPKYADTIRSSTFCKH